ncbi:MAG TPA: hypothetical protein V6D10_12155 [Trichocoleus sp.]|jgi:hypothetical protein
MGDRGERRIGLSLEQDDQQRCTKTEQNNSVGIDESIAQQRELSGEKAIPGKEIAEARKVSKASIGCQQ